MFTELSVADYLKNLGSTSFPSPKGGSASAVSGAMAAALVNMSCKVTERKNYNPRLPEISRLAETLTGELRRLADRDALAYEQVMDAFKLPRDNPKAQQNRSQTIQQAMQGATDTLVDIAQSCSQLLQLSLLLAPVCAKSCVGDLEAAYQLALASLKSSTAAISINYKSVQNSEYRRLAEQKLSRFREDTAYFHTKSVMQEAKS